ncbi:hypothetical protein ACF0H5_009118 [Mactra antiquata]
MDSIEKEKIRQLYPDLVNTIDPVQLLPYLPCLLEYHREQVTSARHSMGGSNLFAVQKLMNCLHTRRSGFTELVQALRNPNIGLNDLADKLDPSTELLHQRHKDDKSSPEPTARRLIKQRSKRRVTMSTRFKDLPQSAISILKEIDTSEFNNAEKLAEVIDLTLDEFETLKARCGQKESLTITILKFWDEQQEISLEDILDSIHRMNRLDIIRKLEKELKVKFEPHHDDDNDDDNNGDDGARKRQEVKDTIPIDRVQNSLIQQNGHIYLGAEQNMPQSFNPGTRNNKNVHFQLSSPGNNEPVYHHASQQSNMVGNCSETSPLGLNGYRFNADTTNRENQTNGCNIPLPSDLGCKSELHHNMVGSKKSDQKTCIATDDGFNSEHTNHDPDDNLKRKFTGYKPEDILPDADKFSIHVDDRKSRPGKFTGYNQVELLGAMVDDNLTGLSSTIMNNQKKSNEIHINYDKDFNITDQCSDEVIKPSDPRPEFTDNVNDGERPITCSPTLVDKHNNINMLPSSVDSNSSNDTNSDNNADFDVINETRVGIDGDNVNQNKCDRLFMPICEQSTHVTSNDEVIPSSTNSEVYRLNITGDEQGLRLLEHDMLHGNFTDGLMDITSLQSASRENSSVVNSSSCHGYVSEFDDIDRPKLSIQSELDSISRKAKKFLPGPTTCRDTDLESDYTDTDGLSISVNDDDLFADGLPDNTIDNFTSSNYDKHSQSHIDGLSTNYNASISPVDSIQPHCYSNSVVTTDNCQPNGHDNNVGIKPYRVIVPPSLPDFGDPTNKTNFGQPTNKTNLGQTTNNTNVGQPTNYTNLGQTTNYTNFGQPTNNTNLGQTTNNTNVGQPTNYTNLGQTTNYTNSGQPTNYTNFGQPTNNTNLGQTTNNTNVGQPTNYTNLGQTTNYTNSGQPTNYTNFGQPTNNTSLGQTPNNTNLGQITNHTNLGQPTNHTKVNSDDSIGNNNNDSLVIKPDNSVQTISTRRQVLSSILRNAFTAFKTTYDNTI